MTIRILLALVLLLSAGCTQRVAPVMEPKQAVVTPAEAPSIPYDVTEHVLANGLKVLILKRPGPPVVSVQVWYRVGSVNETAGQKGMAHLFEHMMFRGSAHVGPEEHAQMIRL